MTTDDLPRQLRELTAEQLSVDASQLVPAASLREDLGLDSLAAIEWGMAIEDVFDVVLPEDAMEHVRTFGDVQALVLRLAAATGAAVAAQG